MARPRSNAGATSAASVGFGLRFTDILWELKYDHSALPVTLSANTATKIPNVMLVMFPIRYDLNKIKDSILAEGGEFTLFGGEPLLMRESDLEELWRWGFEMFGRNRVQTNGVLINETHLRLFRDYAVQVGVSIDGSHELNDLRWAGSEQRTRLTSDTVMRNIERLCLQGMAPSLIVTLHRKNAVRERWPQLEEWFLTLERLGVTQVRLHVLEVDDEMQRSEMALTEDETVNVMKHLMRFERERMKTLHFDVFNEMRRLMRGIDSNTGCVWNACDPYTTKAVRGIEGDGRRSNCGRTNKDGIDFIKADSEGFERYIALYQTPQCYEGCQGCPYFLMCKGQCPGSATGGDWRNRSEYCAVWKELFSEIEHEMELSGELPLTKHPQREALEHMFLQAWENGHNWTISAALLEINCPAQPGR